jgi:serine/threonine-protein kinase
MAPEQVEGLRDLTPAADLYALGVLVFELFTGELPWKGDSVFAVAVARLQQAPPDPRARRPELPEALSRFLAKAMARRAADRFQTAEEFERALLGLGLGELQTGPAPSLRATALSPASLPEPAGKAVAVLPFRNAGPAEDAYLVDGLVEDLIDQLSMTEGLRVRPRGAVMQLASSGRDPRELGRELGVQVVVEGTLRRGGDRLRVNARLISVADGFQLWARRLERPAAEVLALSDELAQAVTQALSVAPQAQPERSAPTDPRALDAYFRGRFEYHQYTPENLTRAVSFLEQARTLAPEDPMILAGYALACTRHWFFGIPGRGEQAVEAAERAVSLAPHRAEPLVALASCRFFARQVPEAVSLLRRALQILPDQPDAHDLLGKILLEAGPTRRAVDHLERAALADPAFRANASNIPRAIALEGRFQEAFEYLDKLINDSTFPNSSPWVTFARLLLWTNDRERAALFLDHPGIVGTLFSRQLLQFILEPTETFTRALPMLPAFTSPHATWRGRALFLQGAAECSMLIDQRETALGYIEQSLEEGLFDLLWMDGCPLLTPLRTEPRFLAIHAVVRDRAAQIRGALG